MAAAVQTFAVTAYGNRTNTTVTKPSGTASGDLLVAFVSRGLAGTPVEPTPPAGWVKFWQGKTLTDAGFTVINWAYKKDAGGSEGASYTWTHNTTGSVEISIVRIDGHIASNPISVITENNGTGTTTTAIGVTTPENNALVCIFGQDWAVVSNSLTAPTGSTPTFTKLFSATTTALQAFFYGTLASAGATGNKTFGNNNTGGGGTTPFMGVMFVVNSAAYTPTDDFVDRGHISVGSSATANQASLVTTLSGTTPLIRGDLAVIAVAVDNRLTSVSGDDNGEVTGVTDSASNTWTKGKGSSFGASAQTGASCHLYYSVLTNPIPIGGTITAAFSGTTTNDASASTVRKFEVAPGKTLAVEATSSEGLAATANNPPSLDATTSSLSCLRIRATALETNASTALTNTTNWTAWTGTQAGGSVGAGQAIRAEHRVSTGTSDASDPSVGNLVEASVYVAFRADSAGGSDTSLGPASADIALSTTSPTVSVGSSSGISPSSGDLALSTSAPTVSVSASVSISPPSVQTASAGGSPFGFLFLLTGGGASVIEGLTLSTSAPTVEVGSSASISPAGADLALSSSAPTVLATDHRSISPASFDLALSTGAPSLVQTTSVDASPAAADITLSSVGPTVSQTASGEISPIAADLALSSTAPTVAQTMSVNISPAAADITLSSSAPTAGVAFFVSPATANLTFTASAPAVDHGTTVTTSPARVDLLLSATAPTVETTENVTISPAAAQMALSTDAPGLARTAHVFLSPPACDILLTASAPSLSGLIDYSGLIQPTGRRSATVAENRLVLSVPVENRLATSGPVEDRHVSVSAEIRGS